MLAETATCCSAKLHGRGYGLHDAIQHLVALRLLGQIIEQHHEFVSAKTRQRIARAQHILQTIARYPPATGLRPRDRTDRSRP